MTLLSLLDVVAEEDSDSPPVQQTRLKSFPLSCYEVGFCYVLFCVMIRLVDLGVAHLYGPGMSCDFLYMNLWFFAHTGRS